MRPADTSETADRVQFELLRMMSLEQRGELIRALTLAVQELAFAGMKGRYPDATDEEIWMRLAVQRLDRDVVLKVYGKIPRGRMMSAEPLAIAEILARILDDLGVAYVIGGSVAASFYGEPRSTLDLDIRVDLDESQASRLVASLRTSFYVDEEAAVSAARQRHSLNAVIMKRRSRSTSSSRRLRPLLASSFADERRSVSAGPLFHSMPRRISSCESCFGFAPETRFPNGSGAMSSEFSEPRGRSLTSR